MNKKQAVLLFKIVITLLVYGYLFTRFRHLKDEISIPETLHLLKDIKYLFFTGLFAANLLLETLKWQCLLNPVYRTGFIDSLASVLVGFSLAIFTPNRSGDWFGKIIKIPNKLRKTGIMAAMYGSVWQTLTIGVAGLATLQFSITAPVVKPGVPLLVFLLLTGMLLVFKTKFINWITGFGIIQRYLGVLKRFPTYTMRTETAIAFFTIARYVVFVLQFSYLMEVFTGIGFVNILTTTSIYFFIVTFIPSFTIVEPGIRISAAMYLFTSFSSNTVAIALAPLLIWVVNLAIPAVVGNIILNLGTIKTNKHTFS